MIVDIYDYTWKDLQSGRLCQVIEMEEQVVEDENGLEDLVIIMWYKDLGTDELHCMSENMFTLKHQACGSMMVNDLEKSS